MTDLPQLLASMADECECDLPPFVHDFMNAFERGPKPRPNTRPVVVLLTRVGSGNIQNPANVLRYTDEEFARLQACLRDQQTNRVRFGLGEAEGDPLYTAWLIDGALTDSVQGQPEELIARVLEKLSQRFKAEALAS